MHDLSATATVDTWSKPQADQPAKFNLPGLAARAFGLDRFTYDDLSGNYREKSTGYFDRPILNADEGDTGARRSVIHDQQTNRDNLFLGYYRDTSFELSHPHIDIMQIAP